MLVLVVLAVEGSGTGTTGVTMEDELEVEDMLDEEDDEADDPPLRVNMPE